MSSTKIRAILILPGLCVLASFACSGPLQKDNLKYEDYDPEDFYEVTGRVTDNRLSYHIPRKKILSYEYFLDKEQPLQGKEEGLELFLNKGEKFIVLVHKQDSTISFFGYVDPRLRKESFKKAKLRADESYPE